MIWGTLFHIMIKVRFFLQIMSHAFLAGLWRHIVQAASFLCLFERQRGRVCMIWGFCFYVNISLFSFIKFCNVL